MSYESYYGGYRTDKFTDVKANDWTESNDHKWDDVTYFLADWKASYFYTNASTTTAVTIADNDIKLVYYLLASRYANSHIASSDENRFKLRVFSLIYQYAPSWIKRLDIQNKLRNLTDAQLAEGTAAQYDTALNPQNNPSLNEPIPDFINQRNKTTYTKSAMEKYGQLWDLLATDVTSEFIERFKGLFLIIVSPDRPLLYETEVED